MMSRSVPRMARSMINHIGSRNFSTLRPVAGNEAVIGVVTGAAGFLHGNSVKGSEKTVAQVRYFSVIGPRNASTVALSDKEQNDQDDQKINPSGDATDKSATATGSGNNNKGIVSYWGIQSPKVTKEDGTPWRWNCFMGGWRRRRSTNDDGWWCSLLDLTVSLDEGEDDGCAEEDDREGAWFENQASN